MTVLERLLLPLRVRRFAGSAEYWKQRYEAGRNSGAGSYGPTAEFKARVLNKFVRDHDVKTVLELGCGDGNQLSLAAYPAYVGLDVAPPAVAKCKAMFADHASKTFRAHTPGMLDLHAELLLSLDVILHLVEDEVYETYMRDAFTGATRFVAIFSADMDKRVAAHVLYREFTPWVARNAPEWTLLEKVDNPGKGPDSISDFFFYQRRD